MDLEMVIPGKLPTMNEILKASNANYLSYNRIKQENTLLVALHARKLPKIERADFVITWYCKDKRKDKDNIMAGQKFILDGLVNAGVIENDGWKEVGNISHIFKVDKKNPRIVVKMIGTTTSKQNDD